MTYSHYLSIIGGFQDLVHIKKFNTVSNFHGFPSSFWLISQNSARSNLICYEFDTHQLYVVFHMEFLRFLHHAMLSKKVPAHSFSQSCNLTIDANFASISPPQHN